MLFKSQVYTQASGSIGGITYSHNKAGMYTRGRSIPVNPNTGKQTIVRSAMTELVNAWTNDLSDAQRTAWNLYASNVPVVNALGDAVNRSGQNWYIGSNVPRLQLLNTPGLAFLPTRVDAGPTTFDRGNFITPPITASATSGVEATIDDPSGWVDEDQSWMILYMGKPQNSTINYFKGPWRIIDAAEGDTMAPPAQILSLPAITAALAWPLVAGQYVWFKVNVARADGRYSTPRIVGPIQVGA